MLQHRNFTRLLVARFLNVFATSMLHTVVGWEVYELTGSAFALGLIGLVQFLPNVMFFLLTGLAADRLPRHRIVAGCYLVQALAGTALYFVLTGPEPSFTMILPILFVVGGSRAFSLPTGQALLPNLVPVADFAHAVAWMGSAIEAAVILGPAVGGLLLTIGTDVALLTIIAIYGCASTVAFLIRRDRRGPRRERPTLDTVLAGIRFIWRRKIILGAISLDLFAVLLGGAIAMLPIYARDILEVGELGLGLLRSSIAVGAIACGIYLARRPLRRHCGRKLLVAVAVFGVAIIVFGISEVFWISALALMAAGAADMISVFVRNTLVQLATPDEMRGRVSAVSTMFIGASNELGEFESGAVAALVGVVPSVLIGGVGTVAVAIGWAYLFPDLLRIDRLDRESLAEY